MLNSLKVKPDQIFSHLCYAPAFLTHQISKSLKNLGVASLDCVYLHNLETIKKDLTPAAFTQLLTTAMEALEKEIAQGRIKYYGIASHRAFRCDRTESEYLSLEQLLTLAEKIGGPNHGFRYITVPVNLAMLEPVLLKQQYLPSPEPNSKELKATSTLQAASQLKLNVMTTQPFMNGYMLQTPLPTEEFSSRYLPVKHLNLIR